MSDQPVTQEIPIRQRPPEEVRRRLRASDLPPDFVEALIEELGIAEAAETRSTRQ